MQAERAGYNVDLKKRKCYVTLDEKTIDKYYRWHESLYSNPNLIAGRNENRKHLKKYGPVNFLRQSLALEPTIHGSAYFRKIPRDNKISDVDIMIVSSELKKSDIAYLWWLGFYCEINSGILFTITGYTEGGK